MIVKMFDHWSIKRARASSSASYFRCSMSLDDQFDHEDCGCSVCTFYYWSPIGIKDQASFFFVIFVFIFIYLQWLLHHLTVQVIPHSMALTKMKMKTIPRPVCLGSSKTGPRPVCVLCSHRPLPGYACCQWCCWHLHSDLQVFVKRQQIFTPCLCFSWFLGVWTHKLREYKNTNKHKRMFYQTLYLFPVFICSVFSSPPQPTVLWMQ